MQFSNALAFQNLIWLTRGVRGGLKLHELASLEELVMELSKTNQIPKSRFDDDELSLFEAIPKLKMTDCLRKIVELKIRKQEKAEKNKKRMLSKVSA